VPWQSGHYYIFSKFIIRAVVPSESGVLGLYSCHERVFIAESTNLRRMLLHLHTDMLRFGFYRPAGFTFEMCPASLSRKRLEQLLAEHEIARNEQRPNIVLYG
jgi:hypothetical protein